MSEKWSVALSFIGIVIIGLGTSLPELAVPIGAAILKSPGMFVGKIVGSNIFDGFIRIGLGATISTANMEVNFLKFDLPVLLMGTVLVLIFLNTKRGISKPKGIMLIIFFALHNC